MYVSGFSPTKWSHEYNPGCHFLDPDTSDVYHEMRKLTKIFVTWCDFKWYDNTWPRLVNSIYNIGILGKH